ncbi:ESX secretion-associated protein EspG [Nocardia sp. 2YAB30]|uniref:ESX secretion-associated protein EspG n=1 Tax=Nocardia sp. 2YAB30 TaxID=3233022 RepID=UPI003F9D6494
MDVWTLDPDDFAALWYGDANDRFPNPLHYRSRFTLRDEFAVHRSAVRAHYPADELERIQLALHTLTTSDIRIEILGGTTKHKGGDGSMRMYRVVGARNPYHAVTLFQSATADRDGAIRLHLCRPDNLPAHLVKSIPASPPGKQPPATFHSDDLRSRGDYFEDIVRDTPREQYQRLVHRPADGGGSASLITGAINTLSRPWNVVQWHDITDDGRYTELRGRHISIHPTTPHDLVTRFTAWIDRALERLAEDRNDTW